VAAAVPDHNRRAQLGTEARRLDRRTPARSGLCGADPLPEQFACTPIHGAVLDELRRQDWAPRSLRHRERDINKARDQFTSLYGRRPTRDELADVLAISTDELRRRQDDIAVSDITSLTRS